MPKISGQSLYLTVLSAVCCAAIIGYVFLFQGDESALLAQPRKIDRLDQIPFDGQSAYGYLNEVCKLGPRVSGSPGMTLQQTMLVEHFEKLGAKVTRQTFQVRHPLDGSPVTMTNLIVTWHPERKARVLLGVHYDTRPFPDRDPQDPRGTFLGANDGGSGVAVLMELGKHMPKLSGRLGVDFVLFDGEELVFSETTDQYFLGSKHFAREYVTRKPQEFRYLSGVVLDMVGDANLELYWEGNSVQLARPLAEQIWRRAETLGVTNFVRRMGHTVNDDHMPLNQIARIPSIDIIDFDYPYWHTTQDVPANCSALSLAKVGWVVLEWLKSTVR